MVFLSDNCCAGYIGNACSNGQFSGFQRYHQEGGIRIPFIMSWPNQLPENTLYEPAVISLDLMSTFTAAAGNEIQTEDSVNLLPYLTGAVSGNPHDYLYWRAGPTIAIRDQRWKMIKYKLTDFQDSDLNATGRLDPPEAGWSTDAPNGLITLLYDLESDPGEKVNLATSNPEIVNRLEEKHAEWAVELKSEAILPPIRSTLTEVDGKTVQLLF